MMHLKEFSRQCENPIEPIIEIREEEDSVSSRILFSMNPIP